jgi:hypothetical protein
MFKIVFSLTAFFTFISAAPIPDNGIYLGVAGNDSLTICIFEEHCTYYFHNDLTPHGLNIDTAKGVWFQYYETPYWLLDTIDNDTIFGKWFKSKNAAPIPFKAALVPANITTPDNKNEPYQSPCACDFFNNPLEKKPPLITSNIFGFEGHRYRNLTYTSQTLQIQTIQLIEFGNGIDSINKELFQRLPQTDSAWSEIFDCRRNMFNYNGSVGDYSDSIIIVFWSDSILCVESKFLASCGGAHPSRYNSYINWNLKTGEKISLQNWFKTREELDKEDRKKQDPDSDEKIEPSPGIWDYINDLENGNSDNYVIIDMSNIGLSSKEMYFVNESNNVIPLKYDVIIPFLNHSGKNKIALLLQEINNRKIR